MKLAAAVLLCCLLAIPSKAQSAEKATGTASADGRFAINLPSSKRIINSAPGAPQRTNSLPVVMAVSPDKRYVAILNAGYGNAKSGYAQSIAILDLQTN